MYRFLALSLAVFGGTMSVAQADATLVFGLQGADTKAVDKKVSVSRFFVRVDSSDEEGKYLLFQAGKFFPLYSVNAAEKTYSLLTPPVKPTLHPVEQKKEPTEVSAADGGREAEIEKAVEAQEKPGQEAERQQPGAKEPTRLPKAAEFKPTKKMDEVAGVRCRIIHELIDGEPSIEHCMANKAALGITEREIRTLSRLLVLARERGYDWLGASTKDEDFVSVRSRDLKQGKILTLKTKSTEALPHGYLKVPRDYKEVKLESAKGDAATVADTAAASAAED